MGEFMSNEMMLRQLVRDRLNAGVSAAEIRAELEAFGLTGEQISDLAHEVSGTSNSKFAAFEALWEWLPIAMLIPGSAALAVMFAMMPRREFAITCMSAGSIMSFVCWRVARVVARHDRKMVDAGGMFFQAELQMIENPKKYWKLLAAIVIGWGLVLVGLVADPTLLRGPAGKNRSTHHDSSYE
jgi:hypothetical protein